jgi:hypothetical protein
MIMAKDKGKKKTDEKVSKKSKGGDEGGFAKPSEAPAGGDGYRLETDDHLGDLFLITPLREQTVKGFEDADTQVIVANVVAINEKKPEKSEEHDEVWIWAKWIQGSLRGYIGEQRVLGRLAQDASKAKGKNAAWVLEDADDDDVEVATEYLRFINNPLNSKSKGGDDKKSKSKADEKPAKKSKGDDDAKASKKSKGKADEKPAKKKSKK